MGAFAAVAKGADQEPRLIVLRYPAAARGPHLGFVGKAVTFDTGGISIKPSSKMQDMKFDMSGGAAVIESMAAIAALGLPVTVTAVVPATENMPSGHAVKPGDIVTAMNGKTIEINNTDAEGRLVLADALCYAVDQGAERIVDLATLTGAIIIALGSTYAGLFSNDDDWYAEVEAAGDATGEIGWRLPLHPEYFELTKGEYADLTNASEARGPSIYAAEFLRQFVDDQPWVHMDIAGTAWGLTRAYVGKGASGFGVRTLVELARRTALLGRRAGGGRSPRLGREVSGQKSDTGMDRASRSPCHLATTVPSLDDNSARGRVTGGHPNVTDADNNIFLPSRSRRRARRALTTPRAGRSPRRGAPARRAVGCRARSFQPARGSSPGPRASDCCPRPRRRSRGPRARRSGRGCGRSGSPPA